MYWVGLLLILVFAVTFRWLPAWARAGPLYLILPALTLGMRSVAFLSRMTRATMQEVLQSDFVRTARAKGLGEGRVVLRHAFRNALLPVLIALRITRPPSHERCRWSGGVFPGRGAAGH